MAKGVVLGFLVLTIGIAIYFSREPIYQAKPASLRSYTYTYVIPKSCSLQAEVWLKGKSTSTMELDDFLTIQRKLESCGGKLEKN